MNDYPKETLESFNIKSDMLRIIINEYLKEHNIKSTVAIAAMMNAVIEQLALLGIAAHEMYEFHDAFISLTNKAGERYKK